MQSALGWDYQAQLAKHGSQTDASKGFGGKYGVQKDLKDKVHMYIVCVYTSICYCVSSYTVHTKIESIIMLLTLPATRKLIVTAVV